MAGPALGAQEGLRLLLILLSRARGGRRRALVVAHLRLDLARRGAHLMRHLVAGVGGDAAREHALRILA